MTTATNSSTTFLQPLSLYKTLEKNLEFHGGERSLHDKVGFRHDTDMDEILDPHLEDYFVKFWTSMAYVAVATIDPVTLLPVVGVLVATPDQSQPLIKSVGFSLLHFFASCHSDDDFARVFSSSSSSQEQQNQHPPLFAALAIDFATRARVKANGLITSASSDNNADVAPLHHHQLKLETEVTEAIGNCPKYLTARNLRPKKRSPNTILKDASRLNTRAKELINNCSTVFVATRHLNDRDTSHHDVGLNHRGGHKGFIRVLDDDENNQHQQFLILPDYSGNRFLQSLGNIESDHVAAVLFIDFLTGSTLHVQGRAENVVGDEVFKIMPLAPSNRLTKIAVEKVTLIEEHLPIEVVGDEESFSPYNPPVRFLRNEVGASSSSSSSIVNHHAITSSNETALPVFLTGVREITPTVATFTFQVHYGTTKLDDDHQSTRNNLFKILSTPGSHAIFDCSHQGTGGGMLPPKKYAHMCDSKPESVNDSGIRTWTVSRVLSGFDDNHDDENSTFRFELTIRLKNSGAVTPRLFGMLNQVKRGSIDLSSASFYKTGMKLVGAGISNSIERLVKTDYYSCIRLASSCLSGQRRERSFDQQIDVEAEKDQSHKQDDSEPKTQRHLWIAGGVGITPFYSLARSLINKRESSGGHFINQKRKTRLEITCFVCVCKPDLALAQPLQELADQLKENDQGRSAVSLNIKMIVSPEDHLSKKHLLVSSSETGFDKAVFCGPLSLKKAVFPWLTGELKLSANDIVTESFDF